MLLEAPIGLIRAYRTEQAILDEAFMHSYKPRKYFPGYTECLSVNPIEYDPYLAELVRASESQ